jgi:hypothetical protein
MQVNANHVNEIIELPKHLQETLIALTRLGTASAQDVADITKKCRAVESSHLNTLCLMKFKTFRIEKSHKKRVVYFTIIKFTI